MTQKVDSGIKRAAYVTIAYAVIDVALAIAVNGTLCVHCTPAQETAYKAALVLGFIADLAIVWTAYAGSRGSALGFVVAFAIMCVNVGIAAAVASFARFMVDIFSAYWPLAGAVLTRRRQRAVSLGQAIQEIRAKEPEEPVPPPWAAKRT